MSKIVKIEVEWNYRREDGLGVVKELKNILPEGFEVKEESVVYFPGGAVGGNHKHPRVEVFVGFGDLELVWEEEGEIKREDMFEEGGLKMFLISEFAPHAVVNKSETEMGILIEWADGEQRDVESVNLV